MRLKHFLATIFITAGVAVALAISGCSEEKAECDLPEGAAACVDDFIITKDDVAAYIDKQRKVYGPMVPAEDADGDGVLDESFTDYRREATRQLVRIELQKRETDRRGIEVTDDEIMERMQVVAEDSFLGDFDAMIQDYAEKGITIEDLKDDVRPQLELEKLEEQLRSDIEVTEDDALDYYNENIGQYVQPDRYTVRQLITDDEQTARQAVDRARDGEAFIELVDELSVDPDKQNKRGTLGLVSTGTGQMPPELDTVVPTLEVGKVSEPINIGSKWYVVTVEAKVPGYNYSFDEKKDEIIFIRSNQLYADVFKDLKTELENEAAITYDPDYDPGLIDREDESAAADEAAPADIAAPADAATQQTPGMEVPVEVPQS